LREELEGDDDAVARGVFPISSWPFFESGIVEGGGEESVEAGRGNCDVDILRLASTAESEEWGTANEDEAVAEISPLLLPWQIHWQWLPERLRTSPLV
jgi:hypothetical protein